MMDIVKNVNINIDRCNMCPHFNRTEGLGAKTNWCLKSDRAVANGTFIVKIPIWCELSDVETQDAEDEGKNLVFSTGRPITAAEVNAVREKGRDRYASLRDAVDEAEIETEKVWWDR